MNRIFVLFILVLASPAVSAQDMPLSIFLIDGEKWKKSEIAAVEAKPVPKIAADATRPKDGGEPTTFAISANTKTVYVGFPKAAAVWAYRLASDGSLIDGSPYVPLRTERGYDNNKDAKELRKKEPPTLAVTGLVVDSRGCIFAATAVGLHVYDPTGRLCGVVELPVGKPGTLWWTGTERNELAISVDGSMFTRKLQTK